MKRCALILLFAYVWIRCPFYAETSEARLKNKFANWIKAEEKLGYHLIGVPPINGEFLFRKES